MKTYFSKQRFLSSSFGFQPSALAASQIQVCSEITAEEKCAACTLEILLNKQHKMNLKYPKLCHILLLHNYSRVYHVNVAAGDGF